MAFRRDLFAALAIFTVIATLALVLALSAWEREYETTDLYAETTAAVGPVDAFDPTTPLLCGGALTAGFSVLAWRNAIGVRRARADRARRRRQE